MVAVWIIIALQVVASIAVLAGIIFLAIRRNKIRRKEGFEKRGN